MNLGPTTESRTFHFMTQKGEHKWIDTVYQSKSLEEAVLRLIKADDRVPLQTKDLMVLTMELLKRKGNIIFNSIQSVIIVH